MNKKVDPEKLKEAAEHLEWVLSRYHDDEKIRMIWQGLSEMIEDAKEGKIVDAIDRRHVPYNYAFSDGEFHSYINPNLAEAYVRFSMEMGGGLSDEEKEIIKFLRERAVNKVKDHD